MRKKKSQVWSQETRFQFWLLWVLALGLGAGWGFLRSQNQHLQEVKRNPSVILKSQKTALIRSGFDETKQITLLHWASVSPKSEIIS